jgi:hypothetical protein
MMKVFAFRIAVLALAASAAPFAVAAPPPDAKPVHAQGCVAAGVEPSCLVVKDTATGKLYNLLIKGAKPPIGVGIEFTGQPFTGTTTCQQGAPVQVANWQRKPAINCRRSSVE